MTNNILNDFNMKIPDGLIVFISGVPGVGKTTISYELLNAFNKFRIIEETDLIREVLRGYNNYIKEEFGDDALFLFDKIKIFDHMKFLSFEESKQQCIFMKSSIESIVARQQRKGIPSIINGVHIVPEVLKDNFSKNNKIIFINLYINNEDEIYNRLKERDPHKYKLKYIPTIYQTNMDLYISTLNLENKMKYVFNNIDVTKLNIQQTVNKVIECIEKNFDL